MAGKNTYMYRVSMGYGKDNVKEVAFCYARNKECAITGMREIFKEKKYDRFDVVMFGEADIRKHPERFMVMPKDEVDYVLKQELAKADAYAQRKPEQTIEFVPESESV